MSDNQMPPMVQQSRYSGDNADNDVAIIVNILLERKAVIIGFCLAAMVLSFVYVSRIKPQFISATEILVNSPPRASSSSVIQSFIETGALDIVELRSHVEILKSPGMVRQLIIQKEMFTDSEIAGDVSFETFDSVPMAIQERMVKNVIKRLAVKPVIGTAIIEVSYRSSDPIKAAQVANDLIDVYMIAEITAKRDKINQAISFLKLRLDELREQVSIAENKLDRSRAEMSIGDLNERDTRLTQIELLSKELANTQARYLELQSIISRLNKADKDSVSYGNIIGDIDNRAIFSYKTKLSALEQERANLGQRFGKNHPTMKANAREITSVQTDIRNEIMAMMDAIRAELDIARDSVDNIKQEIEIYKQSYQGDEKKRRLLRDLETELETARGSYEKFLESYREAVHSLNISNSNIQIVSPAVPPIAAAYPKTKLIVLLCAITGLFMGVFFALILEKLQNVFQSVGQIERMTRIPVYGVLPKAKKLKDQNPADFISEYTATGLAELVRSLYTTLKLRDKKEKSGGRVITMTSTMPDEGKTTVSTWLATVAARHGDRVIIIDADMRRPSLHTKYDIGNARGLVDYLSDRLPLDDVIYKNHQSGVHLMTSKAVPTHALTLISSERMESLMRRLREMYDLIIMDAPTSLIFSDARMLSTLSDKTFYIVEWKKTRRDVLLSSVKHFTDMGYHNMAFIMNKADMREYAPGYATDMAYLYQMNHKK